VLGLSAGRVTGHELEIVVNKVLSENADVVADIKAGKDTKGKN